MQCQWQWLVSVRARGWACRGGEECIGVSAYRCVGVKSTHQRIVSYGKASIKYTKDLLIETPCRNATQDGPASPPAPQSDKQLGLKGALRLSRVVHLFDIHADTPIRRCILPAPTRPPSPSH